MEIKKPAGQIIRDDVRRKRLRGVGVGTFLFGILLLLGSSRYFGRGGDVAGVIGLMSLVVVLAGFVMMAAASWKCPICDSVIYKSGACKCQPSRRARAAYVADLKWRAAGPDSDGGT